MVEIETAEVVRMEYRLHGETDRALADALFYSDAHRAELLEYDGQMTNEEMDFRQELRREIAYREATGYRVEDPNAETLEERLAPWGTEWQIEQRERAEGYGY